MKFLMTRDVIDVTPSGDVPDKNWEYIDGNGHHHKWHGCDLPTLQYVVDREETEDFPEDGHYVCNRCRETVEPKWAPPSGFKEFVAGAPHFFIDGCEVSRDVFHAKLKEGISNHDLADG